MYSPLKNLNRISQERQLTQILLVSDITTPRNTSHSFETCVQSSNHLSSINEKSIVDSFLDTVDDVKVDDNSSDFLAKYALSPEKDYSLYLGGDNNENDFQIDVNMFLNENDNNYKDDDFNDEPKIDIDNYLDSLQSFQPVRNTVSCNFLPSLNDDFLSEMEKFATEPVDNIEIIKPSMSLMGFSRDQPQLHKMAAMPAPAPAPIVTTTATPAPSSSVFGSLKGKVGSIFHSPLTSATTTTASPYSIPPSSHSSAIISTPAISSIFQPTTTTPPPPATYVTTMSTTFTSSFLPTTAAITKPMPTVTTAATTRLPTVPIQQPAVTTQVPSFTPQIPTAITAQLPSITAAKLPTVQPLVTKLPPVKQKEVYVGKCLIFQVSF